MDRIQKEAQVKELNSIFKKMTAGVLIDYRGIEANLIVELRKKLNGSSCKMKVIKNSLARIASNDTPFAELADQFTKTRAIVYSDGDPVEQAKVLSEQAANIENLKILAGHMHDVPIIFYMFYSIFSVPLEDEILLHLQEIYNIVKDNEMNFQLLRTS